MTEQGRPCNFLEGIFVEENVRFVVGLALPHSRASLKVREAIRGSLYQHGAHVQVQFKNDNKRNPTLLRAASKSSVPCEAVTPLMGRTLRQVVEENVATDLPNNGPAFVQFYGTETIVTTVVININHALFDAITMKAVLRDFGQYLFHYKVASEQVEFASMKDWGDLLSASIPSLPATEAPFLPYSGVPLKASDILGPPGSDDSCNKDIVVSLSEETVQICLTRAREHSTTLTGLWMAILFYELANFFFDKTPTSESCSLAISVLVDLRRMLPLNQQNVLQIQATVTVGRQVVLPNDTTGSTLVEWLWKVAQESTEDLKRRIDRGEAHRQGICFSNGKMAQGCPVEATVELSNHGVYNVPEATSIELSQRYDDYQGCSIVVHSESHSGTMKGTASIGSDINHDAAVKLMDRVRQSFELVAS